jgi:hypothetical protein
MGQHPRHHRHRGRGLVEFPLPESTASRNESLELIHASLRAILSLCLSVFPSLPLSVSRISSSEVSLPRLGTLCLIAASDVEFLPGRTFTPSCRVEGAMTGARLCRRRTDTAPGPLSERGPSRWCCKTRRDSRRGVDRRSKVRVYVTSSRHAAVERHAVKATAAARAGREF